MMVGGLPLAMTLKQWHISMGACFFCTVVDENAICRFITCSVAKAVSVVISQIRSLFKWVFMVMLHLHLGIGNCSV